MYITHRASTVIPKPSYTEIMRRDVRDDLHNTVQLYLFNAENVTLPHHTHPAHFLEYVERAWEVIRLT